MEGIELRKGKIGKRNPDRWLWDEVKNRVKSGEGKRPSAEALAQFLDQGGDETIREEVFDWLANEDGAIDELRLLRESIPPVEELDGQLLELAKSRVRNLLFPPGMEAPRESRWTRWVNVVSGLVTLRGWVATAVAGCVLLGFSLVAFRLGTSTFTDRLQTREILMRELTFGLSDVFTMREASPCSVIQNKGE